MKWESMLGLVANEPVFPSALLLAGDVSARQVRLQLSRWVKGGRLLQLRRGLYALAPVWRKVEPHTFLVANRLQRGSYVSVQAALAFHGMIPEHVPVVTSVTTGRPEELQTGLGAFGFRHVRKSLFAGFQSVIVAPGQSAFLATPDKALLDLIYLSPGGDDAAFIDGLRLQDAAVVSREALARTARLFDSHKIDRAVLKICARMAPEKERRG